MQDNDPINAECAADEAERANRRFRSFVNRLTAAAEHATMLHMSNTEKFTVEVDPETATYTLRHPDGTVWSVGSLVDKPQIAVDICGMLSVDT